MPVNRPAAVLDHININTKDRLDAAAELYRRMGFHLSPRGHHTIGSMNQLAVLGSDYLELIGYPTGSDRRPDLAEAPLGMNALVFQSDDNTATYASFQNLGVPFEPPRLLSRRVELPTGARDASFRTICIKPGLVSAGRILVCQHLTRDLVWRDEWRTHPNGAIAVARAVVADSNPSRFAAILSQMFGSQAVQKKSNDLFSLAAGLARVDIMTPPLLAEAFGGAEPQTEGRSQYYAALSIRTSSLDRATAQLKQSGIDGIHYEDARIVVPADQIMGVTLEFVA